ncbi:hypothetical protein K1T71_010016 [Dendrolimus kikuchii]|uniref:Uncharacterized protein n=1 Tax=Dendrolimus kikuchii TaxID=765133 RepID=A0ACC1CTB5_9NEOP|nr:hypothetical protein K1T71_010016 [Dendrolimus kikuchii]
MRKFVRTRAASPQHQPQAQAQRKTNGHANGVGARPFPDRHSPEGGGPRPPWTDPHFPAAPSSLGSSRGYNDVLWMRPTELCGRPRFRADGVAGAEEEPEEEEGARWALEAGALGDGGAGVAVAAAALAPTPRLLDRVVPRGQTFAPQRYTGAFRFRFWVFGAWREVVVDDRLPTRGGRPLGVRCTRPDDFTLPLLEKAYAKLYGGYAALRVDGDGEGASRALQDLSGGVVQSFSLRRQARALTLQVLNSALPRSTLIVATVAGEHPRHGLLTHQPYCVTGLARVRAPDANGDGVLVRVRSATGRGAWTGPWARGSAQWCALPEADRELLAARAPHPAHFWMSFEEFAASFGRLELVHVGPDDWVAEAALRARRPWRAVLARRRWRRGHNAGGPPRAPTAHANPHFHVGVARACHLVVALAQHYEPRRPPFPLHSIGLAVYEVRPEGGMRPLDVTHECRAREVATFFTLPAGQYLVVPHTARAHVDAAFLLRILTDEHTDVWEVNEDNVIVRDVMAEFLADVHSIPPEVRRSVARLLRKSGVASEASGEGGSGSGSEAPEGSAEGPEVEMDVVRRALREGSARGVRVSREVCRALVALRDPQARGALRARELPALVALLAFWAAAFRRYGGAGAGVGAAVAPWGTPRCSSYRLRALLRAAGLTASNKVLECLVLRFADGASLTVTDFVLALARLHLAHERYRSLEAKIKSNPLSLEEMILMTIYS